MAKPLKSEKKSVNLASQARVSKIRRDPPPKVKKVVVRDPDVRETRMVVGGVIAFALSIFIITLGFSAYLASSPGDYEIEGTLD